ncbi:MAG: NADH-quinone oxidoreductase subunit NuoB [Candidatus Omnitrophota bacterium]
MIKTLFARLKQGYRTMPFPADSKNLPERYLGLPVFSADVSEEDIKKSELVCPTEAIGIKDNHPFLDLGRCLFCGECQKACFGKAVRFSRDYCLAAENKSDLVISNVTAGQKKEFSKKVKHIFGRSLKLRQVSAGGCNACEADINVLNTLSFDLGRFGIQFVASPRHADGIVVTGPVTKNMRLALEKTYAAIPSPKLVIVVGACAISGGPYRDHQEVNNGVDSIIPVDLYIPGCPPHPLTILDGLVNIMGKR